MGSSCSISCSCFSFGEIFKIIIMNNEIEEELRQSFIDETKNKLWAENDDNDCGFSEEYVFWLEQKLLKLSQ